MAQEAIGPPPEETLSLWKREQALLKARVVDQDTEAWQRDPAFAGLQRVGGVDVSFVKGDSVRACASLVVLSYPELEVLYEDSRLVHLTAPYLSGFLAFREAPFLADAVRRLREEAPSLAPQVLLVDGNGVLHPRGFGVACHLGVLTDLPCVGVAKKLLQVDGLEKDALHQDQALRSHDGSSKPLYISVGHKMSLETAVRLTRSCCRFRVPEPVRQADIRSRDFIRRTLGAPPPAPGRESTSRAQRPKARPTGGPGGPSGEDRAPAAHSPGPSTPAEAPAPGAQEQ
ncbi:endonuclease V isoform X5 [Pipistrellus kuhlii]|uniref:endonuclease V isoform X5 n=1 Tax=Pipistrellus kuhlii TaxID=59472 RepID=UPI001E274621|nr:endonuclease V isoform X5 [Pipistrellus kuhlii]